MRLRLRLFGLVLIVLVPWLALVLFTQSDERKAAIAHVNADALRLVGIVTSNQATQIEAARQLLTAFARLPQLRLDNAAACNAFLPEMLTAYPLYLNLAVVSTDGNIVCSAVPMTEAVNVADRRYFKTAMATKQFAIGDYQVGRITKLPSIVFAYPVLDRAGKVEAVLIAAQSLRWLTVALSSLEFPEGAILVVTDRHGVVLARMPSPEDWIGKEMPDPQVLAAFSRQKTGGLFDAVDPQGVRRQWAHAPLIAGLDLHAAIGVPEAVAFADINRRFTRNLVALGLVTLIALVAAWFGAKYMLRQVDALVAATGKLAGGDLSARAPIVGGRSELSVLGEAFNIMAQTLQARAEELRAAQERTHAAEIEVAVTRTQLDIARQIQQALLPDKPLALPGVRFAGRCIPAVEVGGDYFGYFPRNATCVDSFVGDVSGHGVGAALLMAEARTTFLSERRAGASAADMLGNLNRVLHDDLDRSSLFMSACCATFDAATRELRYANAGHPPALLLRAHESRCTSLRADGVLLGIDKDAQFAETKVALRSGDIVVFYTDGITETQDAAGELFGIARLGETVATHRDAEPEELIAAVLAARDRFAGGSPHEDDLTIVAMKLTA
jgi:serine phosphatase RsbU (regulator of sigma subunit)